MAESFGAVQHRPSGELGYATVMQGATKVGGLKLTRTYPHLLRGLVLFFLLADLSLLTALIRILSPHLVNPKLKAAHNQPYVTL